jgi:hypothetical protein
VSDTSTIAIAAATTSMDPLSVDHRAWLGEINPQGNTSYLAYMLGTPGPVARRSLAMPAAHFTCPLCSGTATATANPNVIGALTVACANGCDGAMLTARCRAIAPRAFEHSPDALIVIPDDIVAALTARWDAGTFTAGMEVAMRVLGKLRQGAEALSTFAVPTRAGKPLFLIFRSDRVSDGVKSKEIRQVHCTRDIDGRIEVVVGLPDAPWPPVGLDGLAGKQRVLFVEGEKARAAAAGMDWLSDYAVVSTLCGGTNAHLTDWSYFDGLDVTILRDNDEAGMEYADSVAAQLIARGCRPRLVVLLPGLPSKWDIADALPAGFALKDLRTAIVGAPEVRWDQVKHAYRSRDAVYVRPPMRLADGHLAKVKAVVEGLPDLLAELDSGCSERTWLRTIAGIHHAVGDEVGRPMAKAWSEKDAAKHGKFSEDDWPAVYDAIVASPPANPISLKSMIFEAMEQSKVRADADPTRNSSGWTPDDAFRAEANLAEIEAGHRAIMRGDALEIATQERQPDGSYAIKIRTQRAMEAKLRARRTFDHAGKPVKMLNFYLDHQRLPVMDAVFRPGETVGPDEYNLFHGLAVKPVAGGSYRLFRELLDRVSADNGDTTDFLWKLIAWRLQNLNTFVPSALILVGPEGSFKSTITDVIAKLLAPYSDVISDPGKFVGRFNAQLFGKLFVQLEEVSLGKDDTVDSRTKHFINGEKLDVEEKNVPAFSIENRLFVAITSNKRDVIRISPASRRYACYWVADQHDGDEAKRGAHWERMATELKAGGLEALMYDLLAADLAGFNPRLCPRTPLFHDLAGISLDRLPHISWWQEILERGELPESGLKDRQGKSITQWDAPILVERLYGAYVAFCDHNGARAKARTLSSAAWAKELAKIMPEPPVKGRLSKEKGRKATYMLPALGTCREHFQKMFKVELYLPDKEEQDDGIEEEVERAF